MSYLLCDGIDEPDVQVLLLTDTCNNNTRMRTTHSAVSRIPAEGLSEQPSCRSDGTRPDRLITDYRIMCLVTRQNYRDLDRRTDICAMLQLVSSLYVVLS